MPRKNALIAVSANDAGLLTFTVGDAGSFDLNTAALTDEMNLRARLHGYIQKVSDAAAIAKSELSGDVKKDAATKFAAMKAVADRLAAGEWSKRTGDGSGPVAGVIYRAFEEWVIASAKAKKVPAPTVETIRKVYDSKDRAAQLALRNVPEIAKIIERIKSERGSKSETVDTDALLSDLGL